MIDTHAHLDFRDFHDDLDQVVKRATDAGVHTIINIATDFESCERVVELAGRFTNMHAVVGVHPHDAKSWKGPESAARLKELAAHAGVVAIGEIGLDYYRNLSPPDIQKRTFIEQLEVANELKLPIVIHNRDAFEDIFEIVLRKEGFANGGVFHCFSGTLDQAHKTTELGFHISVNGILTYKRATMADVGAGARLDRILLETDAPFLTPHPYRGKRNEPSFIPLIASRLAELRGVSTEEISRVTDENAARLFRLPVSTAQ